MIRGFLMKKSDPSILIGTSGWSYNHWKLNFYPENIKPPQWLSHYSQQFTTVEVNTTFYHLPKETTIKNWLIQVPENFLFSIKASQYITHRKRLKDCKEGLELFYKVLEPLKAKTGPILFQLPPFFKNQQERFEEFISLLKTDYDYVFEFRHDSWFVDEIYALMNKKKIALCITDLNGHLSPEVITSHFTYLRLHGPHKAYQGSYGLTKLKMWKGKIEKWAKDTTVYCYFDNDEKGFAIQDAMKLQILVLR